MVEWLQIYISTSLSFSPYLSKITYFVNYLLNNQILLWSSVVLFIVVLRWLTLPRKLVG